LGRGGEENMALILAIRGLLNRSDAGTTYLAVAVVTALALGPREGGVVRLEHRQIGREGRRLIIESGEEQRESLDMC
jgi:hypothetical protein